MNSNLSMLGPGEESYEILKRDYLRRMTYKVSHEGIRVR